MAENLNDEVKNEAAAENTSETAEEVKTDSAADTEAEEISDTVVEDAAEETAGADAGAEDTEEDAPEAEAEKNAEDTGKKFFKKKKDKKDEKIEELTDRLTRQIAEFDNYRKRTEKEKAANYLIGAKDVIEKILPIVDNFERGLANADLTDPFAEGIDKIYKQLVTMMKDLGVETIEAVGKEFDPNLHNAVMHVEDEALGENVVAEEFQKGYTYKEQVVRHSMVKVAN